MNILLLRLRLLLFFPTNMFKRIENAYLKRGKIGHAKTVLTIDELLENPISSIIQKRWIRKKVQLAYNLRHILEREVYVSEQLQALEKTQKTGQKLPEAEQKTMDSYERELKEIKKDFWIGKRDFHQHLQRIPKGPYIRRMDLEIKYERDALALLGEDICKGKGGCCAYGCGCCCKPRESLRRGNGTFHCTNNCRCCIERRGFPGPTKPPRIRVVRL